MRRGRNLREHRNKQLTHRKILSIAERRKITQERLLKHKRSKVVVVDGKETIQEESTPDPEESRKILSRAARNRRNRKLREANDKPPKDLSILPAHPPSSFSGHFQSFDDYAYKSETVRVCHVIESLGMGGAQTMMMELVNGLSKYYNGHVLNHVVCVAKKSKRKEKSSDKLTRSYGVIPDFVELNSLKSYLQNEKIDIVLHHRIAVSKCLKSYLPQQVKYLLLNHTWNSMPKMSSFDYCDYYLSVCDFLDKKTRWKGFIDDTRKLVILNGVENDYLAEIPSANLDGGFKTGRCHRLVSMKFRPDSLTWMNRHVFKVIPNFYHAIIGSHKSAKSHATKFEWLEYFGTIADRRKKMSILKDLDVYFYETFSDEGASIAVLESLACGVPVLTKPLGGNGEIVKNGVNGFICKDRQMYQFRLSQLSSNQSFLDEIKQKTIEDFNNRLHVKHTACKYMQLFEHIINNET